MRLSHLSLAAAITTSLGVPALAQSPFEGVITVRMHTPQGGADGSYAIKGDKLRMDMSVSSGRDMAVVMDGSAKRLYILLPSQGTYMERPLDATQMSTSPSADASKLQWTGKKETIAGLACEHALVNNEDGSKFDVCLARGIIFFGPASGIGAGGASAWEQQVRGGFPLRVQRVGDQQPVFQVAKVERKALSDDLFSPPAGWQKMSMP